MISRIISDNKKIQVVTQQYEIGLYVCIYDENMNVIEQTGLDVQEKKFHDELQKNYKTWEV